MDLEIQRQKSQGKKKIQGEEDDEDKFDLEKVKLDTVNNNFEDSNDNVEVLEKVTR